MSGPKKQGQIVQIQLIGVSMTPKSQISTLQCQLMKMNPFEKDRWKPGLIDEVLTGLSEINDGNTYRLAADEKKISRGKGKGHDNLFGFEQEVLSYYEIISSKYY